MKKIKLIAIFIISATLAAQLAACGRNDEKWIGVSMPKKDVERWKLDGSNMKMQFEAKGYRVLLEYADDDPVRQNEQIKSMIDKKCKAIVIAASDCFHLDAVLTQAKKNGIVIVAYDRLIMDTEHVDFYVTFNNFEIGAEQGDYLVEKLDLDNRTTPVTMEIFSGALDDSTSIDNYSGQLSVLRPYIDNGTIIVRSGQTDPITTAIENWATENAQTRMSHLLATYYTDTPIDIILSANDSMALGAIAALKNDGYGGDGKPFPFVTGLDCDIENVIAIKNGEQSMSMFVDTRALANLAVTLVDDVLNGKAPKNLNTERFHNNVKIVASSICKAIYVDINNYLDVLTKDGYYKPEDFE